MNAEKLAKLEEKLYNETPLIGDRIRKKAAQEIADIGTPEALILLAKALSFSKDKNVQNIVQNVLRQIKLNDNNSINAVCRVWADTRDSELAKFLKLKAWVASQPLELRMLTALNLGWKAVFQDAPLSIVATLLKLCKDKDRLIAVLAREWALSLETPELQQEICRLASEENNQLALEIAEKAGYIPHEPAQAALFYYLTQRWEKYQEIDPESKFLEEAYYSGNTELKTRIDQIGENLKRQEWVWMLLGGKEGRRLDTITPNDWEKIVNLLSRGKYWQELWSLVRIAPVVWTQQIITKLQKSKWLPENPSQRATLTNLLTMFKKCSKHPPKGKLIRGVNILKGHTLAIESMILSPNGKLLISAGDDIIRVWDLDKGELLNSLKGHLKSVTSLSISDDGLLLASGSRDKTVSMWRLPEGNLLGNLSSSVASIWCLGMSGDGKLVVSGSYQELRLWQYPSGKLINTLRGHKREVECLTLSRDGSLLVTGGGDNDNTIRLWQLPQGTHLATLTGHTKGITAVAISPDNTVLATASKDSTVRLWNLPRGEELAVLEQHTDVVRCLAISLDGHLLATGSDDNTVNLWQLPKGQLIKTLEGHTAPVWCLQISQDGQLLVTGSKDKTIRLWQLPKGDSIGVLTGHTSAIRDLKISPDGQILVSGSEDKTLRLWKWDLPRLCNMSVNSLTDDDRRWIQQALKNPNITDDEKIWLVLLNELSFLDFGDN
jgi:WD40 repeat protein